jgi:hypothetical protein
MPIDWSVDEERHCLQARFFGALTWQEITDFQTNVSLTAPYLGYHGLLVIDRTTRFPEGAAADPVQLIARRAAAYNGAPHMSRLAIVTETETAFGLVRMFMAFCELAGGTRSIGLFRSESLAYDWLFPPQDGADT